MTLQPLIHPTKDQIKTLYLLYLQVFDSYFTIGKKISVMTHLLGHESWGWRVVGISDNAIKAIKRNGYKHPARVLVRHHPYDRATTYRRAFKKKMKLIEWWKWVWKRDVVQIITREEHSKKVRVEINKITARRGYFPNAPLLGWYHRPGIEGELVKKLAKKLK